MKRFTFFILINVFLVSSCGVFLGPMSELSLEQRMSKGWKVVYEFTNMAPTSIDKQYCKILIGKSQNEIRCFYYIGFSSQQYLYYFNSSSYGNQIAYTFTNSMPNIIDISHDDTNSYLIFFDTFSVLLYNNGTYNAWPVSSIYYINGRFLVANDKTIIGTSMMWPNSVVLKGTFNDFNSTNGIALPNSSSINGLYKCRNKFNNDNAIYATYWDGTNFKYQLELFSLNNMGGFMLTEPFFLSNAAPAPIIESDGNSRMYMVHEKNIYRYDGATKSFVSEFVLPENLSAPSNFMHSADFVGDNLIILKYDGNDINNPVKIWSYNVSAKCYTETKINENRISNDQVIGIDMYYDRVNYALYAAILYYDYMSLNLHGVLYKNQM